MAFFSWPDLYLTCIYIFFLQPDLTWTWIYLTDLLRDWTWSEFTYIIFYMNWTWSEKKSKPSSGLHLKCIFQRNQAFFSVGILRFLQKQSKDVSKYCFCTEGLIGNILQQQEQRQCWRRNFTRQILIKSVPRDMYPACYKF